MANSQTGAERMPYDLSHLGFLVFFQAEDGIRALVRSRGLGDLYKGQAGGSA